MQAYTDSGGCRMTTLIRHFGDIAHFFDALALAIPSASPAGIEAMFEEQAAYFASLQGPPDHSYLAELGARFGVSVVGPPLGV